MQEFLCVVASSASTQYLVPWSDHCLFESITFSHRQLDLTCLTFYNSILVDSSMCKLKFDGDFVAWFR